jgi:predicted unusual protein kinase regulating ubiquinone biosynthesis (AarF/ABC1/UbiB family)
MEPFDSRLAVEIIRRELAPSVGGVERGTGANRPSAVLPSQQCFENFLSSLSPEPVAAASIGQVYRGYLDGYGPVAVKVRRPDIEQVVERDAALLRSLASSVEQVSAMWHASTPFPPLVKAKLVDAVDEFMNRIREELDYRREAENLQTFASLYSSSHDQKQRTSAKRPKVQVVVPRLVEDMCTENVLVTEWLDGSKLVDQDVSRHSIASNESAEREIVRGLREESLSLVLTGIECTLSQLLDTGILHADPHSGNLLKVPSKHCEGSYELGYLDFGLLSRVPSEVRDGLVCAVAQLVFARNVDKVARLFGELQLLPQHVLHDPTERQALAAALDSVFEKVLDYSESEPVSGRDGFESRKRNRSAIPGLRFDSLLVSLAGLVTRFEFQLPPYFLNNARALGTLEGIAKSLDPAFNVLRVVYPYALNRLLANPSNNPVVDETLLDLLRCPSTGTIKASRVARLLDDSAALTGYSRRRVAWDVLKTCGGRRLARKIALGLAGGRLARVKKAYRTGLFSTYFKL